MDRAVLLEEMRALRRDIDHYMNTGEIAAGWEDSPDQQAFKEYIDAMKKHLPIPHSINDIIEREAVRRLEARGAGG